MQLITQRFSLSSQAASTSKARTKSSAKGAHQPHGGGANPNKEQPSWSKFSKGASSMNGGFNPMNTQGMDLARFYGQHMLVIDEPYRPGMILEIQA